MIKEESVDRQFRLARHWSNDQLRLLGPLFSGDILNVSGGTEQDKQGSHYREYFSGAASYSITNYGPDTFRGFEGRDGEILLDLEGEVPAEAVLEIRLPPNGQR